MNTVSSDRIPTSNEAEPASGVRALSTAIKTLAVLDAVGASPRSLRLAEVVEIVGGNRASVYQKLLTLMEAGWLEDDGSAYRLSLHANRVGAMALTQAGLGERARSVLESLVYAARETASLALLDGHEAYLAQRVESAGVLRAELRVGTALRLETSASGRVLCAFADAARLEYLRQAGVTLPSDSMMAKVRRDGYSVSSGLDVPGVRAIAAPVFDHLERCVGALSLVAPDIRFDENELRAPLLRAAAQLHDLLAGEAS